MKLRNSLATLVAMAALLLGALPARGQWLTQSFDLKAGWNAIYLHVDSSHATLDELIGANAQNLIQEVWMWSPNPNTAQFVTNPQSPAQPTHWLSWVRVNNTQASLKKLPGNVACLVRSSGVYTWTLKGKPVTPAYSWTSSGLNFFGFPTLPGNAAPSFDTFFTPQPELKVTAEIFNYVGGPIESNPALVSDTLTTKVRRGEAFWMRSAVFNHYFGPFTVTSIPSGAKFGDSVGQVSFRIRNVTPNQLTVKLQRVASEAAPAGQTAIQGQVPILVRGNVNPVNLGYTYSDLGAGQTQWTLEKEGQPGSEVEVVLGVNRQNMTGPVGSLYASILRLTDSLNYSQVDVPATATVGSYSGLWIGDAKVSSVSHYLNSYATASNATQLATVLTSLGLAEGTGGYHYEIDPATSRILVFGGTENKTGAYLKSGAPKVDQGAVARPYSLRLLVHNNGTIKRLLQRVYLGTGLGETPVVATKESLLLPASLANARRASAAHLPFSEANAPWEFTGSMQLGASMTTTVETLFDNQAANPFLHTYHPDHDNLNALFNAPQPEGTESYGVRRQITMSFTSPDSDFDSLTKGAASLNGSYVEIITFLGKGHAPMRQFDVRGTFTLNRITDLATLTQ